MPSEYLVRNLGQALENLNLRVNDSSRSITYSMVNDTLTLKFLTIANTADRSMMQDKIARLNEESIKLIADYVSKLKDEFSELSNDTLSLKEIGSSDSVEMVSSNPYNPRRTIYYRRNTVFEIDS